MTMDLFLVNIQLVSLVEALADASWLTAMVLALRRETHFVVISKVAGPLESVGAAITEATTGLKRSKCAA